MHSSTTTGVLELLKSTTATQHRRLESLVDIMNPSRDLAQYTALLRDFHAFYAPLETQVLACAVWDALGFDFAARCKRGLLERDLNALGATPLEPYPYSFLQGRFASALGAMYVMEGATLGGQVIGRHLHSTLGLTPATGSAFFCSYGERVGPMWLEFRSFLSAQATDDATVNAVVDGAVDTFTRFGDWLEARSTPETRGAQ